MADVENKIGIESVTVSRHQDNSDTQMTLENTVIVGTDQFSSLICDTVTEGKNVNIAQNGDIPNLVAVSPESGNDANPTIENDYKLNVLDGTEKRLVATEVTSHPLLVTEDDDSAGLDIEHGTEVLENSNLSAKKNRRVFFPEGGKIVSGYMEPPCPWNDVSTCSTEELIEAYKSACDRFGIKPLQKLMHQLNVINDFSDRNETLTLRGERLDLRHCETIEEILRRVQFRTIDLENTHLDDEGTVALFDMIEHYESCSRLNISNNRTIGVRGWQACARLMKKTPCLLTLEARNCVISEQVMPFFCRSLKMGSCLTVLHLENSIMSGRHLIILTQALKLNGVLTELYLADNKLLPSDGIQLGNLLRYNFKLELLDVRNNNLQDVGTSHICDGIWEQNMGQGLTTIVLWNNQITFQSMNSLSRALTNTKSLETLNLGHNNITNEGIHRLKDGLLHNKSLLRIGLQASKISCEGSVALAEFIAESPRLRRIDLRENDIKTGGLMALSLSLKVSQSVTRIDLDKEPKKETSMKDYMDQQRRLLNDINNFMQRNRDWARQREEEQERLQQDEAEAEKNASNRQNEAAEESELVQNDSDGSEEHKNASFEDCFWRRPLILDLPHMAGSSTLDSPAFTAEENMPIFTSAPPLERPSSFEEPILTSNDTPLFFPPSPMVSDKGKPMLTPMLGSESSVISPESTTPVTIAISHPLVTCVSELTSRIVSAGNSQNLTSNTLKINVPKEVVRKLPNSSPTGKRKFIISRVQESQKACPPIEQTKPVDLVPDLVTGLSGTLGPIHDSSGQSDANSPAMSTVLNVSGTTGLSDVNLKVITTESDSSRSAEDTSNISNATISLTPEDKNCVTDCENSEHVSSTSGASGESIHPQTSSNDSCVDEASDITACVDEASDITACVEEASDITACVDEASDITANVNSEPCLEQAAPSSGESVSDSSLVGAAGPDQSSQKVFCDISSLNGVQQAFSKNTQADDDSLATSIDSEQNMGSDVLEQELEDLLCDVNDSCAS